jgi:hypothetical protein
MSNLTLILLDVAQPTGYKQAERILYRREVKLEEKISI